MKIKKLLLTALSVVCISVAGIGFAGCSLTESEIFSGEWLEKLLPTDEHTHSYGSVEVIDPTCTQNGYTKYICECGYNYTVETLALDHRFESYIFDNNATCLEDGTKTAKCERDGCEATDVKTERKSALGHSFIDYVSDNNGTCLANGTKTAKCDHSGCEETDVKTEENSLSEYHIYNGETLFCADCQKSLKKMEKIRVADGVTNIANSLFYGCEKLTGIILPESVTNIGNWAFFGCSSLTDIVIPENVASIGEWAFSGCSSLTEMNVPESVINIGEWAFSDCSALTYITVDKNNSVYKSMDGNLYTKDGKTLVQYAIGKMQTSFTISDEVTVVGNYAFYNCNRLTEIVIPNSVTTIGEHAFYNCNGLAELTIGDGVETVKESAFYNCNGLREIVLPNSVKTIGEAAFRYCIHLEEIVIPNGVEKIENFAFYGCTDLMKAVIGESVTSIGEQVFADCDHLIIYCETESKKEEWHEDWNRIGNLIVWDCDRNDVADDGYIYVDLDGLRYRITGNTAVFVKPLKDFITVNISSSVQHKGVTYRVTAIGDSAFHYCFSLKNVIIPRSVTTIGKDVFYECNGLMEIVIPSSVTSMGENAFNTARIKIYCEAESRPIGWAENWSNFHNVIVWGYKGV